MRKSFQIFVKNALCGVIGSERIFKRVLDTFRLPARLALNGRHWRPTPKQIKSVWQAMARTGRFTKKGTLFLCLLRNLSLRKYEEEKRMDWEMEIKDSSYLPEKGKPTEKIVKYAANNGFSNPVFLIDDGVSGVTLEISQSMTE